MFGKSPQCLGPTCCMRFTLLAAQVVDDLVAGNRAQPAAKSVSRRAFVELCQLGGDGFEDLLEEILSVGGPQAAGHADPAFNERTIDVDDTFPGALVVRLGSL